MPDNLEDSFIQTNDIGDYFIPITSFLPRATDEDTCILPETIIWSIC